MASRLAKIYPFVVTLLPQWLPCLTKSSSIFICPSAQTLPGKGKNWLLLEISMRPRVHSVWGSPSVTEGAARQAGVQVEESLKRHLSPVCSVMWGRRACAQVSGPCSSPDNPALPRVISSSPFPLPVRCFHSPFVLPSLPPSSFSGFPPPHLSHSLMYVWQGRWREWNIAFRSYLESFHLGNGNYSTATSLLWFVGRRLKQ